jgi:hypothetical protein
MRLHDIRMALAAMVAFGPVVFAAAYGVANASRLQAVGTPTVAAASVQHVVEAEHTMVVSVGLDRPRSK